MPSFLGSLEWMLDQVQNSSIRLPVFVFASVLPKARAQTFLNHFDKITQSSYAISFDYSAESVSTSSEFPVRLIAETKRSPNNRFAGMRYSGPINSRGGWVCWQPGGSRLESE